MSRQGKPYLYRGWWGTKSGGAFTKLAPEGTPANTVKKLFHEHAAKLAEERPVSKSASALLAWEICEKFSDFTKANRTERTFGFYRRHLQAWIDRVGNRLASSLTADDLETWKQELLKKGDSPCYVNHRLITIQTAWNYAVKLEMIPRSPFNVVEKLHTEGRQRVITPAEFRALLRHSTDAEWKQFLVFMRLTGSRPGELRGLDMPVVPTLMMSLAAPAASSPPRVPWPSPSRRCQSSPCRPPCRLAVRVVRTGGSWPASGWPEPPWLRCTRQAWTTYSRWHVTTGLKGGAVHANVETDA